MREREIEKFQNNNETFNENERSAIQIEKKKKRNDEWREWERVK
jgi:hypothetical protein